MSTTNYLNLIFSGYFKNPNTLKRYLIRNQKIEERDNFITEDEFYDSCKDVVLKLKEDIYFQYNNRKSELLEVLDLKKHKGIDTIETQKQYDRNDLSHFTINLYSITNQKIKAYLSYSEIEFVENTINQLVQKDEHNEPQQKETKNPDEVKENKYLEIFRNDLGYSIFLGLHNIYKLKPKEQANYSFLFYALDKDYLVCSGSDFITFLSKLNIHIDKIDSRQSGTNNKRDLFNSIQDKFLKAQ